MAVQYAFSQITTTGLKLAVDAADPLSYPGSGTTWTDVTGNGFTGTISSSISFATTNRGALVSSNSASAVIFSGSAANFGSDSFTIEMAFSPSRISGTHWLYSKNSGSFPNFGAYITGSSGSGRIVAFYNVSSTVSSSAATAVGSIVTGSNYVLDVTHIPSSVITSVYLNSNYVSSGSANGLGSLSTSASLLLLNNTTASSAGTMGNLYNFKVYNPFINSANIRKNYNSMCSRFGLPLALYTPPAPFLLDIYAGAAAAYSLRLLRTSYTGNAIRVRRSSDNTEQDIGFDGDGNLNTGALLLFCGAGNGFVTTWYDQSGNARNVTQTTATSQPQIVSSGNIILQNSKPCIDFDGSDDTLRNLNSTILLRERSFIFVGVQDVTQPDAGIISFRPSGIGNDFNSNDTFCFTTTNNSVTPKRAYTIEGSTGGSYGLQKDGTGTDTLNYGLYLETKTSGEGKIYQNGVLQATDISFTEFAVSNTQAYNLGSRNFNSSTISNYFNGKFQEFIYWEVNNITNRTGIESNINSYYTIY